jgi:primary-amine oxidase
VIISPELKAAAEGSDTVYPYVQFTGNGLSVPGSTPGLRKFLGTTMIVAGPEDGWTMGMFKAGPLTYVYHHDLDTDVLTIEDLVFCPGAGNPTFESPQALLDAFNAGTLIMCGIDGEFCEHRPPYQPIWLLLCTLCACHRPDVP